FLRQALERTTGAEHTTRRRSALLNLGLVYLEAGALRRSAEHFELTLALLREAPVQSTQALALTGLGDSRRALGDLDTAAMHHTRAHAGLAQALLDLGRQRESLHHARRTLAISLQAGYRLLQAQALHALAAVDLAEQHPEEALQHAHAALALYQKAECPLGE